MPCPGVSCRQSKSTHSSPVSSWQGDGATARAGSDCFCSCISIAPGGMEQKGRCDGSGRLSADDDDDDAEGREDGRPSGGAEECKGTLEGLDDFDV